MFFHGHIRPPHTHTPIKLPKLSTFFRVNPKRCKGGWNPPYAQEIGCHFSRNDPNVLKLPDFFKNDVGPKVKESFWAYLE